MTTLILINTNHHKTVISRIINAKTEAGRVKHTLSVCLCAVRVGVTLFVLF